MSKLSDLGQVLNGASIPKTNGVYPAYGGNGIITYVNQYNYSENTIIIGRVGANCGAVYFSECKCWVTDNALAFTINDNADAYFVYNLLKMLDLNKYHIGSSQPLITQSIINNIEFGSIPQKSIQKHISQCVKAIDDKISNNNRINAELESMAKTIYDYWFTQFDFPDENDKPYKSSGGKMVWNEELKREIPEGWEVTHIGDITICHDSKRIPLSSKERENKKGEIPYYGATGIMDYVDEAIFDGDYVLMAEDGSVMNEKGNPILQRVSGKVWINNHAHVLEPSKKHCCKLLMMLLRDIQVSKIKTGSIQMKINQENMNKIAVPDIPDDLIVLINDQLNTIDKKILHNNHENQQLASLRDWLLPMLMNGQVGFEGIIDSAPNGNN